ncbi:MAG: hypothetical protein ACO3A2_06800 [Bdellovibrionia bacterium]
MKSKSCALLCLALTPLLFSSCSHLVPSRLSVAPGDPETPQAEPAPSSPPVGSSVQIEYLLRRTHYSFFMESNTDHGRVKSYLDRQLLKEGRIPPEKCSQFFLKISEFMAHLPEDQGRSSCQSPFKITYKKGELVRVSEGCRSSDSGSFSKLIREGEFLLYSVTD